jgi:cytochrome c556
MHPFTLRIDSSFHRAIVSIACLLVTVVIGCGTAPQPGPAANTAAVTPLQTKEPAGSPTAPGQPQDRKSKGKWLGKVPYDIWFDDPLSVAADAGKVSTALPEPVAMSKPEGGMGSNGNVSLSMADETDDAKAAGDQMEGAPSETEAEEGGWSSITSTDGLQTEIKLIRNRLSTALKSQGQYNGNYKEIQVDGAVLAAVGGVAPQLPGDMTWKKNAKHIRDLGARLREGAKGLGKEGFEKSQTHFEQVTSVLGGSLPAGLPEAADDLPLAEVADRGGLMIRMEKAYQWLYSNIKTEARFKSDAEAITHELEMLTLLSQIVADKSYESADEDEYKAYINKMITEGKAGLAAAKAQDFRRFSDSLSAINTTCNQCHADYRSR